MARRAPMAHMSWRASPLLLCALPSSIGADACDCGQYGATQAWSLEQRGAACDSVPTDHHGPCFQSCCCEGCAWLTEQPTGTAAPAPTDSSSGPRWWLWLVNFSPERSVCVLHCSLQTCQQHILLLLTLASAWPADRRHPRIGQRCQKDPTPGFTNGHSHLRVCH